MAIHTPTNQHRNATPSHKSAPTPPRAAVKGQGTSASKRNAPLALSKTALMERVAERSGTSLKAASAVVNATLEAISEALKAGNEVRLMGFGSFGVRTRAAHQGVNPQTHARIRVPAKQQVRFSAGKGLSDAVAR
jgi:DNA-binding protein HU-beta